MSDGSKPPTNAGMSGQEKAKGDEERPENLGWVKSAVIPGACEALKTPGI